MKALSPLGCIVLAMSFASAVFAGESPCTRCATARAPRVTQVCMEEEEQPSWVFRRSTYTHDPMTGARVAQYQRLPVIEPLEDERLVTSRYHRTQTNLRGTNGSSESYYDVQQWGNGRGGIDAEWERFHNAWKESYIQGGFYNQQGPAFNNGWGGPGWGGGWGGGWGNGWCSPGWGFPGNGFPGNGFPGIGAGGPWINQGAGWNGNGPQGNGGQFNGHGHAGDWN